MTIASPSASCNKQKCLRISSDIPCMSKSPLLRTTASDYALLRPGTGPCSPPAPRAGLAPVRCSVNATQMKDSQPISGQIPEGGTQRSEFQKCMTSWGRGVCPFPSPKGTPIIISCCSSTLSVGEGTSRHKVDFFHGLESAMKATLISQMCHMEQWLPQGTGVFHEETCRGRGKPRGIYSGHGCGRGCLWGGLGAQAHHCFKAIFQEPSACTIQEHRW